MCCSKLVSQHKIQLNTDCVKGVTLTEADFIPLF